MEIGDYAAFEETDGLEKGLLPTLSPHLLTVFCVVLSIVSLNKVTKPGPAVALLILPEALQVQQVFALTDPKQHF